VSKMKGKYNFFEAPGTVLWPELTDLPSGSLACVLLLYLDFIISKKNNDIGT